MRTHKSLLSALFISALALAGCVTSGGTGPATGSPGDGGGEEGGGGGGNPGDPPINIAPPSGDGLTMPSMDDEKAAYQKWGWTWNNNVTPDNTIEPISNYSVGNINIHSDTEGDDLWTYTMMYRRSGNTVYLNRAQAWANYFKNTYRTSGEFADDGDMLYDHLYGYGLVTWYEHTAQAGNPDTAALTEAENLAAVAESYWSQTNGNGSPRFVAGQQRMGYYGMRQGARHLLLATRVAEATQKQRWITLRDKLIDLWLQSPDWTWADSGNTMGMYYYGDWDTNTSMTSDTACWYGTKLAGCPYYDGARIVSPFQIGILTEAFEHAYRTTGRTELRDRMVALARYVAAYGMDSYYQYTGSRFGIVNGQKWHNYSSGCGTSCTDWDPVYSTSLVNTLVRGYKYTGDKSFYTLAQHYFNRGTKGIYGSATQRAAGDNVAHHFVDTRFDTSYGNFYLAYNKGELIYTYLLFENGGLTK